MGAACNGAALRVGAPAAGALTAGALTAGGAADSVDVTVRAVSLGAIASVSPIGGRCCREDGKMIGVATITMAVSSNASKVRRSIRAARFTGPGRTRPDGTGDTGISGAH